MPLKRLQRGIRVTLAGMAVNTLLAAGKIAAGVWGHSHALVADGVESLADLLSAAVVWRGLVVADTPPDKDHPYGHGKAEAIAVTVVATMLWIAALWIGVTAVREIVLPHSSPAPFTLAVLIAVVVIKESLFRYVNKQSTKLRSTAVRADAWHHRSDAVTSLAAGVGIAVALVGGPGYEAADDWGALIAAGIIGFNGWKLQRDAISELMDASPSPEFADHIRRLAESMRGVKRVEKCLARKMGSLHYVDLHIEVDADMSVREAHEIAHRVKDRLREAMPEIADVLIHIEPAERE